MTISKFRWLVFVAVALPLLLLTLEWVLLPNLVPDELKTAYESYSREALSLSQGLVLGGFVLIVLPATIVSVYGLIRFKRWAPRLALWATAASYLLLPFTGAVLQSGLTSFTLSVGAMLWGVAVSLPYVNPEVQTAFRTKSHS